MDIIPSHLVEARCKNIFLGGAYCRAQRHRKSCARAVPLGNNGYLDFRT